ncbi:MAG: cysteine--tRNA ligase, partial [Candidatus Pacebacteria bacterium]|nr:cysteine--tRNA ligase [Candidatus Paceibacterota bacterium]
MALELYNSLTKSKEIFTPLVPGKVGMYHCGPTVYDTAHIGNLRTYVFNDVLRRSFEYLRYEVKQVMNITDVDDKTVKNSQAQGIRLDVFTKKYTDLFLSDLEKLNIEKPHLLPLATEYIKEMVEMIGALLEKNIAYVSNDGVYMSIGLVKNYGALAGIKLTDEVQSRINNDEYEKENPRDFALWKFHAESDGEVVWPAPFGDGRPGWHIECSAMSIKNLGETFDVHTGGIDLMFPHHVNEIAQSESATGKKFVNYWLHGAFINVNDAKMAKSKGNFLKLSDLEENQISPLAYRYWLLTSHYRTQVNFTLEAVEAGQNAFIRLAHHVAEWGTPGEVSEGYKKMFIAALEDDIDMPRALALAHELSHDETLSDADKL